MWNVFEQPWTLVGGAVIVLFGVLTFRSVIPERRRWWQWLLPVCVAVAGFGLDGLVETDLEKIHGVIEKGMAAVRRADCAAIGSIIAEDYHDSHHINKVALMRECRSRLETPIVEKIRQTGCLVELSEQAARATLFAKITFTDDSFVARDYKKWILIKLQPYFGQRAGGNWLINRVEIVEIDKQPVNWQGI